MASLPGTPSNIDTDEWRRAIALMAAVDTHADNTTISATTRERNVLASAKKYETYLQHGRV